MVVTAPSMGPTVVYAGTGPALTRYAVDIGNAALTRCEAVRLPAGVQYAWPHANKQFLYVASSDRVAVRGGPLGSVHHISAFRIDPATGALKAHGNPVAVSHRPIHVTTDMPSHHLLVAYCNPSGLSVHKINADGTIGAEVVQRPSIDAGVYAHQIRVTPDNQKVILVTRGHGKPYQAGALKIFQYRDGLLGDEVSVNPGGANGFGPRHLDFHPSQPWFYVSLEDQHQLCQFALDGGTSDCRLLCAKNTLAEPGNLRPFQYAGTVHLHPHDSVVYVAERASGTHELDGRPVHTGGENAIVAYALDPHSGEPKLIQRAQTRGLHPRTFALDAGGRILIAANKSPVPMPDGSVLPASLDVFRVSADGTLDCVRNYAVDVGEGPLWWMGVITLP